MLHGDGEGPSEEPTDVHVPAEHATEPDLRPRNREAASRGRWVSEGPKARVRSWGLAAQAAE